MRMFHHKNAAFAPTMTAAYVFFNILLFIMIYAFSHDGESVGTKGNAYSISDNESLTSSSEMTHADAKFFESSKNSFTGLPFWANVFIGFFEAVLAVIIILAWIRGF